MTRVPTTPPSMAPRKREGANTPPEPPEPMVIDVATILVATRAAMVTAESVPARAREIVV